MAQNKLRALREIGARLKKLYPDMVLCSQPDNKYFTADGLEGGRYDCSQFIANAPVATDAGTFHWHVDADPVPLPFYLLSLPLLRL